MGFFKGLIKSLADFLPLPPVSRLMYVCVRNHVCVRTYNGLLIYHCSFTAINLRHCRVHTCSKWQWYIKYCILNGYGIGIVWYGYSMVWYRMVSYGIIWYSMLLYGMVLHDMIRYGMMRDLHSVPPRLFFDSR